MEPIIYKELFNLVNVAHITSIMCRLRDETISNKIINFKNLREIDLGYGCNEINNIGILSSLSYLDKINLAGAKFRDESVINLNAHKICVDNKRLKKLKKLNNKCVASECIIV